MKFWLTRDTYCNSYDFWYGIEPPVKQDRGGITGITYHENADGICRRVNILPRMLSIPLQPGECREVRIVPVESEEPTR